MYDESSSVVVVVGSRFGIAERLLYEDVLATSCCGVNQNMETQEGSSDLDAAGSDFHSMLQKRKKKSPDLLHQLRRTHSTILLRCLFLLLLLLFWPPR